MIVKQITPLENGYLLALEEGKRYFCTDPDFCPEHDDGFTKIVVRNGGYDAACVYLAGRTTNAQAALDIAVDFLIENDVAFDHCDYYEAQDNDMVTEDGEVMDSICAGNTGVYLPSDGVFITTLKSIELL